MTSIGEGYTYEDAEGDDIDVIYFEKDCPDHGREGGFMLTTNSSEAVMFPSEAISGLIRYLLMMLNYSRRPESGTE